MQSSELGDLPPEQIKTVNVNEMSSLIYCKNKKNITNYRLQNGKAYLDI